MTATITPSTPERAKGRATTSAITARADYLVRDPICGMEFNPSSAAATRVQEGETHYFCAEHCAREFDRRVRWKADQGIQEDWATESDTRTEAVQHDALPSTVSTARSPMAGWVVPAVCVVAVAVVLAVTAFGVPATSLLVYGAILLCPLMHLFMMRGHGGPGGHGGSGEPARQEGHGGRGAAGRRQQATGTRQGRSCH
jgi:YHS domain-containing protein